MFEFGRRSGLEAGERGNPRFRLVACGMRAREAADRSQCRHQIVWNDIGGTPQFNADKASERCFENLAI